jgi:predicted histone-like DNA-binding protein
MPAKYIVVAHKNPSDPDAPPKYYPRLKTTGQITERELLDEIDWSSTLNQADMKAALEALLHVIPRHLKEGRIVRLGELGSFYLTVQAEGTPDIAEASEKQIIRNRIQFRPGKMILDMLKDVRYEKE